MSPTGTWKRGIGDDCMLNGFISVPKIIIRVVKYRRKSWAGPVVCMGERRGVCVVLQVEDLLERPEGRSQHMWEHNIKKDLYEI